MTIHYLLLHGSLGWADELIFVGVGLTFLVLMAIQWAIMHTRDSESMPPPTDSASEASEEPDRFRLD